MAIVLKDEKSLKGQIKKKQQEKENLEKSIKENKAKLRSLRKKQLLNIFLGNLSKHREQIDSCKNNIDRARSKVNKLSEEIYGYAKGHQGEEQISALLESELSDDFYVINGKQFKTKDGRLEIDQIVIGPKGLICIEVKNMSGRFFFNKEEESWLKTPFSRPDALGTPMPSPLEQVKKNTKMLKNHLLHKNNSSLTYISQIKWHTLVVFTSERCLFHGIDNRLAMETPLLLKGELIPYIHSLPEDEHLDRTKAENLSNVILRN